MGGESQSPPAQQAIPTLGQVDQLCSLTGKGAKYVVSYRSWSPYTVRMLEGQDWPMHSMPSASPAGQGRQVAAAGQRLSWCGVGPPGGLQAS